ncbi:MAG: RHS repeat-associated core domain-containing protein [Caldilineaceae bacterium]
MLFFTSGATPTSFKYTGQRQEAGIGLYFYGARWYDPALGRFTQPDTIVPNPGDAQAFDRYAYVLNNPLKYHDPTGHCVFSSAAGGAGSGPSSCGSGMMWLALGVAAAIAVSPQFTNGPSPLVAPQVPSWDEFWPQQKESTTEVTGFPTITAEDDGLLSTPRSPAPGMDVLTERGLRNNRWGAISTQLIIMGITLCLKRYLVYFLPVLQIIQM